MHASFAFNLCRYYVGSKQIFMYKSLAFLKSKLNQGSSFSYCSDDSSVVLISAGFPLLSWKQFLSLSPKLRWIRSNSIELDTSIYQYMTKQTRLEQVTLAGRFYGIQSTFQTPIGVGFSSKQTRDHRSDQKQLRRTAEKGICSHHPQNTFRSSHIVFVI
jgi:hypothetical protein